MAILIEHFAGDFPLWLSPVQAKILPISDAHVAYVDQVKSQLVAAGYRVEVDDRAEKVGLKIREAEMQKVPYMLIVGEQEMAEGSVALRKRKEGNVGKGSRQENADLQR